MAWTISGILVIIIFILILRLQRKSDLDKHEQETYSNQLSNLKKEIHNKQCILKDIERQTKQALSQYNNAILDKNDDLNEYFSNLKEEKEQELEKDLVRRKSELADIYDQYCQEKSKECKQQIKTFTDAADLVEIECRNRTTQLTTNLQYMQDKYDSLIAPLKQLEMEQQQRLYYTIQVPDDYKDDINFLITQVSQQIKHPDIINKLVWAEYVKPYIDDTFKRAGIEDKPGIYKLTFIGNGKCYIGKSTNIKKRITDHIKSSIGISTIADQAVHHQIWRTGFWNWTIEPIIYCEKERLNELEKYYINFFKSQEYGFNKNAGGGG